MSASAASDSKTVIGGLLIAVGVLAGLGALTWLYNAEPWYSKQLIERMQGGTYQAPWRDETARISNLFPDGMRTDAAVAVIKRNGFSCDRSRSGNAGKRLECIRKISSFVCVVSYTVSIAADSDELQGLHAQSYAACL